MYDQSYFSACLLGLWSEDVVSADSASSNQSKLAVEGFKVHTNFAINIEIRRYFCQCTLREESKDCGREGEEEAQIFMFCRH